MASRLLRQLLSRRLNTLMIAILICTSVMWVIRFVTSSSAELDRTDKNMFAPDVHEVDDIVKHHMPKKIAKKPKFSLEERKRLAERDRRLLNISDDYIFNFAYQEIAKHSIVDWILNNSETGKPLPEEPRFLTKATGLTFNNRIFYLNGKPFKVFSGAIHYFRVHPVLWYDRLKKLKASGLNTVETYVPWNMHEPSPGEHNFEGILDLRKFVKTADEMGLFVILRPGPYICAEFDFGGLPGWLLLDPLMRVRSNYKGYLRAVDRYFSVLMPKVLDLQFTEGGPIIMFQVENEYAVYGSDILHLKMLTYLFRREGIKELLVTSDHGEVKGQLAFNKYALPTTNFAKIENCNFQWVMDLNPHFPLMAMELWTGWFDTWGQKHHSNRSVTDLMKAVNTVLDIGGSFNLYMFHGGTNFGMTSGAINLTRYGSFVTSYDYDAILTEAGDITPKYIALRNQMQNFYKTIGIHALPPIPPNSPKGNYGMIQMKEVMEWSVLLHLLPIVSRDTKVDHMEVYMDSHGKHRTLGYVIYTHSLEETHWNKAPGIQISNWVNDRLVAILNNQRFMTLHGNNSEIDPLLYYDWDKIFTKTIEKLRKKVIIAKRLDLMVENLGRVNYSPKALNLLNQQFKGLYGPTFRYIFGSLMNWEIRSLTFDPQQITLLSSSHTWLELTSKEGAELKAPSMFRAFLELNEKPKDTFVRMTGWSKGVLIVNGFTLGRYWHIGPQKTLYLPAPVLKNGTNEIIVFEEERRGKHIHFESVPDLG